MVGRMVGTSGKRLTVSPTQKKVVMYVVVKHIVTHAVKPGTKHMSRRYEGMREYR